MRIKRNERNEWFEITERNEMIERNERIESIERYEGNEICEENERNERIHVELDVYNYRSKNFYVQYFNR